jgi:hypothetical protein
VTIAGGGLANDREQTMVPTTGPANGRIAVNGATYRRHHLGCRRQSDLLSPELREVAIGTTVLRVTCDRPPGDGKVATGLLECNSPRGRVGRDRTEPATSARIAEPPMP